MNFFSCYINNLLIKDGYIHMKQLPFIILFMFITLFFLNADDPYKPVTKTDAPDFWWYDISAPGDFNADPKKAINTIILPSELEPGLYETYYYHSTSSDDFIEVVDGPTGRIQGATNQTIDPHYVNGFYTSAPCTYPFKIHVIINPSTEVPPNIEDQEWIIPTKMNVTIKNKNDSIYDLSHYHTKYTFDSMTYESLRNIEFDLEPETYAIFIPEDGLYAYYEEECSFNPNTSSYEPCTKYVHTHVFGYKIYFMIDRACPQRPEEPWLAESINQYKIQNNYYTNESSGIENNKVSFEWFPVADNGVIFNPDVPEYCSGTAGYYMNIYSCNNNSLIKTETIIDDTSSENSNNTITHMISLDEGEYFVRIQAYDKYGNDGPESFPGNPPPRFIVDRTPPGAPSGMHLENPAVIGGTEYTDGSGFTLGWDPVSDLPGGACAGTAAYRVRVKNNTEETKETYVVNTYDLADPLDPVLQCANQVSGEYTACVRAVDGLDNRGEWSNIISFSVDGSPPGALSTGTCSVDDPFSVKETEGNGVVFHTTREDIVLQFAPGSDGTEPWQSGITEYKVFEIRNGYELAIPGDRIAIADDDISLSCPGLSTGETIYCIYAVDGVGNQGPGMEVTINRTDFSPATFPSPCYIYEDDRYFLVWNAPETMPTGASVAYYKVIVIPAAETTPGADAFAAAPEVTDEQISLDEIIQGDVYATYVQATDTLGNTSLGVKTFHLPPLVIEEGEPYELPDDEFWWSGLHEIETTVIVPEGTTLTVLPGAEVRVKANAGIRFIVHGSLIIQGTEVSPVLFNAEQPGHTYWEGIYITGEADILHGVIRDAERGITTAPGSDVEIGESRFIHNLVGLHAYGASPGVTACWFEDCEWYGVKEDAAAEHGDRRPVLTGCVFKSNGYDYYHETERIIGMEELNQLPGNSNNRREE
jgi:hypothetical protein